MSLKLVIAPVGYPVTVAEAKERLGISDADTDQDSHVEALIAAATGYLDGPKGYLLRALMPQTWDLIYDSWPDGPIQIPLGPLIAVEEVAYINADTGLESIATPSLYDVDTVQDQGWVIVGEDGWPDLFDTFNAVRIRFEAGYPVVSDGSPPSAGVPEPIKLAICRLAHYWFDKRDVTEIAGSQELPYEDVKHLLARYRVYR